MSVSQLQTMTLEELLDEFHSLADWEEQCDYLIDLGFELPEFPDEERTEENRVRGCQSNVWLVADVKRDGPSHAPVIEIRADSDAMIVRGLIAVLLTVFNGRAPQEILETDIEAIFSEMGLNRHLSSTRRNGLFGMVKRVREIAAAAA